MSVWKCTRCGQISHIDDISSADGLCLRHPAGVGNHQFKHQEASVDLQAQLDRVFFATPDELLDMAEKLPEEEARILRNASYDIESVRTSQAVGELMQAAAHLHGATGPVEYSVSRLRRAA